MASFGATSYESKISYVEYVAVWFRTAFFLCKWKVQTRLDKTHGTVQCCTVLYGPLRFCTKLQVVSAELYSYIGPFVEKRMYEVHFVRDVRGASPLCIASALALAGASL